MKIDTFIDAPEIEEYSHRTDVTGRKISGVQDRQCKMMMYAHACVHVFACVCISNVLVCVYLCVRAHVCVLVCACVCMCKYACISLTVIFFLGQGRSE